MTQKLRWGILGTGFIAGQFTRGLKASLTGTAAAVGSRTRESARTFGAEHGIERCHGSYAELVGDPDVDAIYVSTPHSLHKANSILALRAGKPVLCEKPFAINRREAEEMISVARAEGLFIMEAMWTRFIPAAARVRELVRAGAVGEVRMIQADFGFSAEYKAESRLFDPAFGGGSLLDVGIYPLSFSSMILGTAKTARGIAHIGATGVDEEAAFILGYENGASALCSSAVRLDTPQEATVIGRGGHIRVHSPFWRPSALTLGGEGREPERIEIPFEANGYHYQADEVARCLSEERLESDIMPLAETLDLMGTMDALRAEWGVRYPME